MIDPCPKCVVEIVCKEICEAREDYTKYWKDLLTIFKVMCNKPGRTKIFDGEYLKSYLQVEKIEKENLERFYSTSTTCSSDGPSSSSSSSYKIWKRGTYKEFHDSPVPPKKKTDYLKMDRK